MDERLDFELLESPPPLPDQKARTRVLTDLDTNLLLEAGAGSGKTTALVGRMVALVRSGAADPRNIAAVTFTRKAAAELREGFQTELEKAVREETDTDAAHRLTQSLQEIDQAFIGTINAFCAHLLRERPIEAGLDPGFEEMLEAENARLLKRYWVTFLERMVSEEDPALTEWPRTWTWSFPPRRRPPCPSTRWTGCGGPWTTSWTGPGTSCPPGSRKKAGTPSRRGPGSSCSVVGRGGGTPPP